jgi:hypothetical protein
MSRRTAILALVILALAAACHSSEPIIVNGHRVHWLQSDAGSLQRRIDLVVPAALASDGSFMRGLNAGVLQANRSPYVEIAFDVPNGAAPTVCPDRHCITVARRPMNGAYARLGFDGAGHIYGRGGEIGFDSAPWPAAMLANAACHELFHVLGLAHSSDGTPGPCQAGVATTVDLANVRVAHAHGDRTIYAAEVAPTAPLELRTIDRSTRAEIEAMS